MVLRSNHPPTGHFMVLASWFGSCSWLLARLSVSDHDKVYCDSSAT